MCGLYGIVHVIPCLSRVPSRAIPQTPSVSPAHSRAASALEYPGSHDTVVNPQTSTLYPLTTVHSRCDFLIRASEISKILLSWSMVTLPTMLSSCTHRASDKDGGM